ncbi:MAG: hypothetical protein M9919_14515 [Burkholderiaceae bacterium]|jgi:hypothetical protein|nr:hypothetical protein [Burkholderiaceae bacterium]
MVNDIDTPSQELPQEHPQRSVDTTVPVQDAQGRHAQAQAEGVRVAPTPAGDAAADPADADLPQLPHERDQSVGMTDGNPSARVQQAYKDVTRGLVNTDAGREAHNVGKPVVPPEPPLPGAPGPVEPDHK